MLYKLFALVLLSVALASAKSEEDPCVCNIEETQIDQKAVFAFLEKIQQMAVSQGKTVPSVLPGILGPLVACGNCLDRKKRNIMPVVREKFYKDNTDLRPKRSDTRCPKNYIRIVYKCVHISFLDEE